MEKFLREKGGKTVIGWDEIIDNASVPNTIVMAYRGHARAVKAIQQNQYTILTPNRWCYLDYYQEDPDTEELSMSLFLPLSKVYNYDPVSYVYNYAVETPIKPEQEKYILGQQGCIWTEYISNPKRAEYMAFPRAIAMSEIGWSSKENKDWDSFCKRMIKEFKRLDQKNVNYSKAFYHVIFNYNREAPFPKKVALSLDYPEAKNSLYHKWWKTNSTFTYLFRFNSSDKRGHNKSCRIYQKRDQNRRHYKETILRK